MTMDRFSCRFQFWNPVTGQDLDHCKPFVPAVEYDGALCLEHVPDAVHVAEVARPRPLAHQRVQERVVVGASR